MVELKGVTKEYKTGKESFKALDNVSLNIRDGEFVSILGPSGSGKSTLMHLIGGLDRPSSGTVLIGGVDIEKLSDRELARLRRKKIGFVFQSFNLLPNVSAFHNVMMPLMYVRVVGDKKEYVTRTLASVNMEHKLKNRPSEMSGGEQQRVAIARALICKPEMILADEPTGNLDTKNGAHVFELLTDLNAKGKTVIVVTHDEKLAAKTNRTIRIQDGKIQGESIELPTRFGGEYYE